MRLISRRAVLLVAIAAATLVGAALVLSPRKAGAPTTADASPSVHPAPSVAPIAERDPRPWGAVEWTAVKDALGPSRPPLLRVDGLHDAGDLIIGWGRTPMPGRNQFSDMGAVFLSRDGSSWQTVPMEHGVNDASTSELSGIASGPSGYLAYGGVCCEPEGRAVWHSTDGAAWQRLQIGGEPGHGAVLFTSVVGVEDGWIAVGNESGGGSGSIWASADGAAWDLVMEVEGGLPGATVTDVTVSADGLIAVGTVSGPDGTYDGAVWTSSDGRDWVRRAAADPAFAGEGETRLDRIVPFAGGLFVTGAHGSTEERESCEQLGMLASVDAGPQQTALSCGWGTEHQWLSPTGEEWERVNPADAAREHPIEWRLIAAGGPGLVVLGESSAPASPDTALFVSADGRDWTRLDPARPVAGGVAYGLVVRERDVLAVTDEWDGSTSEISVWIGSVD